MAITEQRLLGMLDDGGTTSTARKRLTPKRPRIYPREQVLELVDACRGAINARLEYLRETRGKVDPQTTRIIELLGAEMGIIKPKLDQYGRIDTSSPFDAKPARAPRGEGSKNRKRDTARDRKAGIEPQHDDDLGSLLDTDAPPAGDQ